MIEKIYDKCRKLTEEQETGFSLMVILVPAGKPISALESIVVATYQTPEEGAAGLHSMVENVKPEDLLTQSREEEIEPERRPGAPVDVEVEPEMAAPESPQDRDLRRMQKKVRLAKGPGGDIERRRQRRDKNKPGELD